MGFGVNAITTATKITANRAPRRRPNAPPNARSSQVRPVHLKSFEMSLGGASWSQEPQKYHARSLAEIRRKYAAAKGAPGLEAILKESGCLKYLTA